MDFGRVVCVIVANRAGQVLYERFYIRLSEAEKADIRLGLHGVSQHWLDDTPEEAERVGRYKAGTVVFIPTQDVVFYALGTGEYEELMLSQVLSSIMDGLKESLKVPLTERNLIDKYSKMLLVVDEVVNEGIVDQINPARIVAGTNLDMRQ